VGTVIADNIFISGFSLAFWGLITFIGLLFLSSIVFAFQLRKYRRSDELLKQKETDYFNAIIKLMKKVDTPEKMEEIIAYYTDVPRFYTDKAFQEEIAKALIHFNGHKGIIAEVKRCSKFLDNFEIRRALRETAA